MIVHVSFCGSLLFRHIQRIIFSAGIQSVKNFHCAPVVNADDVPEPRMTLKQIEKKKLEKRSEYIKYSLIYHNTSPRAGLPSLTMAPTYYKDSCLTKVLIMDLFPVVTIYKRVSHIVF